MRVEQDQDSSQSNWFGFHNAGGDDTFQAINGCTTHNGVRICPPGPQSESFVFDLGGGDDLVDLSHAELTLPFVLPSTVSGGSGADELRGGLRGDDFTGGPGNDTLARLAGADRYLGGDGDDTLDLRTGGPWTVSLDGVINDGPASSPRANVGADVEVVLGGPLNDILGGTAGKQTLNGGGESDVLDGGPDGDTLSGEGGDDLILARDRSVDVISCGAGGDSVTADWNDVVVGGDCEVVNRDIRDDDGDKSPHDIDCDDANPAIRPGGGDLPGNGVDEDCDGTDAVLDRDGDGAAAGVDCDDANPARRPGAVEVPANKVDEDCDGRDAKRAVVAATFASGWSVFASWTVITRLQVKGAPAGAKLQVRCNGKGCPFRRNSVKLKKGAANLTKRFKDKRLKPGAVIELRVTAPGAIGRVQRITIRERKDPKRTGLCPAPGASKPRKCS